MAVLGLVGGTQKYLEDLGSRACMVGNVDNSPNGTLQMQMRGNICHTERQIMFQERQRINAWNVWKVVTLIRTYMTYQTVGGLTSDLYLVTVTSCYHSVPP